MGKQQLLLNSRSLVLLTAGLVLSATFAVGASGWTRGLNIILFVGLGSILMGMMLARSILIGFLAHVFSLIIGIGWSFWVTTRLLPAHYTWIERWENLAIRLNSWYNTALQGGTSYDNLMFILQMSVIVWCMGYLTVWFVFRTGRVWQAIVPSGVVLTMNLYYAPNDITFWFLVYLLLSLILVIRFNTVVQEANWRAEGIFYRPDVGFDLLRDGVIFSALIIGVAWLTPPVVDAKTFGVLDNFQGRWQDVQSNWNRLYADLNYRNETAAVGVFGQSFALGGPRYLTDQPVMDVQVDGVGRYWRATIYDEYNGIGWRSTHRDSASVAEDATPSLPQYLNRQAITQTYTLYRGGSTVLYAMGSLVDFDRTARITFNTLSNEQISSSSQPRWERGQEPYLEEISYIRSDAGIDEGESYTVVSAVSQASINQLRNAGTQYPEWISERYLQLPPITDRTRELAQQITADASTPYDKAQAIERYLRNNLSYNEAIQPPPPGVDKVDYILFDLKEAYCDYYATSMITMLRSQGVPARMAAGYAQGTYDSDRDVFHVINADAHSWVEVYFPRYGWIEFEPTAAQPNIIRPEDPDQGGSGASLPNAPNPDDRPDGGRPDTDLANIPIDDEAFIDSDSLIGFNIPFLGNQVSLTSTVIGRTVSGLLLFVVIAGGGLAFWWNRQQTHASRNIANLYEGMIKLARWTGAILQPWQTPYEQATVLKQKLPGYHREVDTIADDYVQKTFSQGVTYENSLGRESQRAWRVIRPVMVKLGLKRLLPWNRA